MYFGPVKLPKLTFPYVSRLNLHIEAAEVHTWEWVRTFDLIKSKPAHRRFQDAQYWRLAASAYPDVAANDLNLASDWISLLFIQSDMLMDARSGRQSRRMQTYADNAIDLMRNPRLVTVREAGPLLAALSSLWQRLQARMTSDQTRRFITAHESYFAGCMWELENRAYAYIPAEQEYITTRRDTSGFRGCILLAESLLPIQMSPSIRDHPALRRMTETANDIVSWTNDLYSLEREVSHGDTHNLALVLRTHNRLSVQDAVDLVGTRIMTALTSFEEQHKSLPAFKPDEQSFVPAYIDALTAWIQGNFEWSQITGRYRAPFR